MRPGPPSAAGRYVFTTGRSPRWDCPKRLRPSSTQIPNWSRSSNSRSSRSSCPGTSASLGALPKAVSSRSSRPRAASLYSASSMSSSGWRIASLRLRYLSSQKTRRRHWRCRQTRRPWRSLRRPSWLRVALTYSCDRTSICGSGGCVDRWCATSLSRRKGLCRGSVRASVANHR